MPRKIDEWFPLYVGRYLGDTMHLTYDQHGPYLLLLMHYWRKGPLPDDDHQLAAIARVPPKAWQRGMARTLRAFFTVGEDGMLHQKRADEERAKRDEISDKRSAAGKAGADAKYGLEGGVEPSGQVAIATVLPAVCETQVQGQVQESLSPPERARPEAKGTRLSEGWCPTPDGIYFAEKLGLDSNAVLAKFKDHWRAQPGQKGRKSDWEATWRNWCRHEVERGGPLRTTQLPLLRQIDGGRSAPPADDPNDAWGIDRFCRSIGADLLTDPKAMSVGSWGYRGRAIDATARKVAEAAGFPRAWRGDWGLLKAWIDDGLSTGDHILPAVTRMAAWCVSQRRPATSLAVFDKAVREQRAA